MTKTPALCLTLLFILIQTTAYSNPEETTYIYRGAAKLSALNKITTERSELQLYIKKPIKFGNLTIVLNECWTSAPLEVEENKALLTIWEHKPKETPIKIFTGWVFSSSPSISLLQHAVYDINLLECNERKLEQHTY